MSKQKTPKTSTNGKHTPITDGQRSVLRGLLERFPDLETIEDADTAIQINVTHADQKHGKAWEHSGCAMAVACKREHHVDGAYIQLSKAYLISNGGKHATRYMVPPSVSREVVTFDRHQDFATGTYQLSPVSKTHRFGHRKVERPVPNGKPRPSKAIVIHHTTRVRN